MSKQLEAAEAFPIGTPITTNHLRAGYGLGGIRLRDIGSYGTVVGHTRMGRVLVQWVHERDVTRSVDPEYIAPREWAPRLGPRAIEPLIFWKHESPEDGNGTSAGHYDTWAEFEAACPSMAAVLPRECGAQLVVSGELFRITFAVESEPPEASS